MSPRVQLVILAVMGAGAIGFGIRLALRMLQANPEKRERKRRMELHQYGRLGDALITEATDTMLYYSYSVRGVQYEASQDVGSLRHLLPPEPDRLFGTASPRNPGNSILICEEWSGLRAPSRAA